MTSTPQGRDNESSLFSNYFNFATTDVFLLHNRAKRDKERDIQFFKSGFVPVNGDRRIYFKFPKISKTALRQEFLSIFRDLTPTLM